MPNSIHEEILTKEQIELLPTVETFSKRFGLAGGTAVALQIGHRRSIDFDLFSDEAFDNGAIRKAMSKTAAIDSVVRDEEGQFTLTVQGVRFTFLNYPYPIEYSEKFHGYVRMPNLLTLAAMKAHALGRRAKWKDYVDLYFIMTKYHGAREIVLKAKEIFGDEFNEKVFRVQLAYFKDIDYSETIDYMPGLEVDDTAVQKALIEYSLR